MKHIHNSILFLLLILSASSLCAQNYRDIAWIKGGVNGGVADLAVFAGRSRMVVAGNSQLTLWDLDRGLLLRNASAPYGSYAVAVSPDERLIANGGATGVQLWDATSLAEVASLSFSGAQVNTIDFSANGRFLAAGSADGQIHLWDLESNWLVDVFQAHSDDVTRVEFAPFGDTLASVGGDYKAHLWKLFNHEPLMTFGANWPSYENISFSPAGRYLALGNYRSEIWMVDLQDTSRRWPMLNQGGQIATVSLNSGSRITFSPDGQYLAGGNGPALIWVASTGQILGGIGNGTLTEMRGLTFTPDGKYIYAGDRTNIASWDATSLEFSDFLTDFSTGAERVEFSPDGKLIAASAVSFMFVYDAVTGKRQAELFTGRLSAAYRIAFSKDGHYLAAGGFDSTIRIWNVGVWGEPRKLSEYPDGISGLAFSPDGHYLASARYGAVNLWDLTADTVLYQWLEDSLSHSLEFSPDGRYLVSASGEGVVLLWDVASRKLARTFSGGHTDIVFDVAYSPDGRRLVSGGYDGRVVLWDVESGQKLREYQHKALVTGVGFASGGRTVLSGSFDGTIVVHDAETWDSLYSYSEYPSRVTSMAVSPNGDYVAMGADDALVMYYGRWKGAGAVPGERSATLNAGAVLYQNVPNPFTEETTIRYLLPEPGEVRLYITDALGTVVREVEQGRRDAGEHSVFVSTASLGSGLYFYHVESGGGRSTRQMMVVR